MNTATANAATYFDYPLEQGLRHWALMLLTPMNEYFDYPLEQGLRQNSHGAVTPENISILIIH